MGTNRKAVCVRLKDCACLALTPIHVSGLQSVTEASAIEQFGEALKYDKQLRMNTTCTEVQYSAEDEEEHRKDVDSYFG